MKRVLVLGGYGGFGARLSRRLDADGWHVLVAGRNLGRAEAFASELDNAEGIWADRDGDLEDLLARHRPDLLIDAAGPFQGSDYRVPLACIAQGVSYCDIADARGFVCGIGVLNGAAKKAGVAIISGGSSIPALSGAVTRELSRDMERVSLVDMSICASSRATAGGSVAEAALSYAGKPIRLWQGRRWLAHSGWQLIRRENYAVKGRKSITRYVSLADIPDHDMMPAALPGNPATIFRLGSDSALQIMALWLLAWLVRLGWVRSASAYSRVLLPIQRAMVPLGGAKSAMAVEVAGYGADGPIKRRWTLLAEDGQGAEIPTLASQLAARELRRGGLAKGAYDASQLFALEDFESLFSGMPVYWETRTNRAPPVYQRALGEKWAQLPKQVRLMHDFIGDAGAEGSAKVTRGTSPLARLVNTVVGFPPTGEHELHVAFAERGGKEVWTRDFGGDCFSSELSLSGAGACERFGPMNFHFDLPIEASALHMKLRRWNILGIPMPRWLAPRITAYETEEGEDFIFDVDVALPLIGRVVHYRGRLRLLS